MDNPNEVHRNDHPVRGDNDGGGRAVRVPPIRVSLRERPLHLAEPLL